MRIWTLQVVLLGAAFFSLLSAMAGLDLDQMLDEFSQASWRWVVIGAVVAHLPPIWGFFAFRWLERDNQL